MELHVNIETPVKEVKVDNEQHPPASPEEIELLQKLEAANRLLEKDEKSLKSVSANSNMSNPELKKTSRKGSNASMVSSNSINSHISNLTFDDDPGNNPDEAWVVWSKTIGDWENINKKKPQYIRDLVRKGIPHHFRGIAWQFLCGAHNSEYKDHYAVYLKMASPCEKVIRRDITRTYPDHDFFREKDGLGQESLFNVMKAYSLHDREVGYCQGSGFIVGLLLMQMPEEETFAVLVKLMQDYRLRELFKPTMAELGLCFYQLEYMIQENMPNLYLHFQSQSFHTSMYASQWFLTLYTTALPLSLACRIMDVFLLEGIEIIFKVGIALLQDILGDLLCLDMEQMLQYFQKDVPARYEIEESADKLMESACQVKYNAKKMKKLEKEYNVLKTKEHEDQVELRRLRSENKLLRHRIDNLEKENVMLADRLIHGQVTRAHEAEDMFVLKRDLATLRQQHSEALEKFEEANDMISQLKHRADSTASNESQSEEIIRSLRTELNDSRLRHMSQSCTLQELKGKVRELDEENSKLHRDPNYDVQTIQDELIAVKLREAEANLSTKELRQRVNELEKDWRKYTESYKAAGKDGVKPTKSQLQTLHDELIMVKLRETDAIADLKEMKQKVMELETQNHICSHQIKRLDDENLSSKQSLEESLEREKILKTEILQWERRDADTENRRKEEEVMEKIRAAEHSQANAEMRRRIAELEIKNQELLTINQLSEKTHTQDLENQIVDLEEEVLQLKLVNRKTMTFSTLDINKIGYETDSEAEYEELDTTIIDIKQFRANLNSNNFSDISEDNGEIVDEEGVPVQCKPNDSKNNSDDLNVGQGLSNQGQGLNGATVNLDEQNCVKTKNSSSLTTKTNGNGFDTFSDEMEKALDDVEFEN